MKSQSLNKPDLSSLPYSHAKNKEYNFHINNRQANKGKFKSNSVTTTKYNIFTFLPKSLLYQYYRPEKIYYLILIVLENIPIITPIIPISTMVPYLIVLIISMIREGIEDFLRYKYDKELNSEKTIVYRNGTWIDVATEDLKVGELVLVKKNLRFPADLILIDSDKEEGVAYIETSTLDGEISLKKKFSPKELAGLINEKGNYKSTFPQISGTCKCERPNTNIFQFNGVLRAEIEGSASSPVIAVDNSQMLLKGAVLKTNEWVVGIVTYAGHDTKLIRNLSKPKIKESKVFNLMTLFVLYVFIIQAIFCFTSAGLNYYDYNSYVYKMKYLPRYKFSPGKDSVLIYFSYLIIYKFMIPITLYVTFELVRIIQAYFLWVNANLYSHYRQKHLSVGTVSIIEELGSVDYIFTDKTGTLTRNKMEMKYCVIGDTCYEYLHKDSNVKNHKVYNDEHGIIEMEHNYLENFIKLEKEQEQNNWIFRDFKILNNTNPNLTFQFERESVLLKEYWKAVALAHECVAEEREDGHLDYIGLSPDDIVLVKSAAKQGFVLQRLDKASSRKINIIGENHEFEVLNIFEFNSERKRLSIIVRDQGVIKMYIKGADSVIKKLLSEHSKKEFDDEAEHYVDFFSKSGLRTLYVAMKIIDEDEYNEWRTIWEKAIVNLEDKNEAVKKAQEIIEKDFYLIGATVVEDKLQDEVPETIKDLRQAGIKIWMITGDKMDTAYNIGISCNLISKDNQTFFVKGEGGDTIDKLKKEYTEFIDCYKDLKKLPDYSIVIDAVILSKILENEELIKQFIEYSNQAKSVICCRVSPLQKSEVVKIMKKHHPKTVSLAIGDGGNDVSMILEAHIGVGVYGEEGLRAVQSADFAVGEFKILRNLLLVHGRQCHIRMNNMILCFFYKCYIFCLVHFLYGFYNCFSAQTIYDDWLITFYNIGFTFFPIVVKSFSDWDIKPDDGKLIYELDPELYKENRDKPLMNYKTYYWEFVRGFVHCIINFYFCVYSLQNIAVDSEGNVADLWYIATILYLNLIIIGAIRVTVTARYIISLYIFSVIFTTLFAVGATMIGLHFSLSAKSHSVMSVTWGSARLYLITILTSGSCCILDVLEESLFSMFGNRLYLRLLQLIKVNNRIDHIEKLPDDIKKYVRSYQGELTQSVKREMEMVIINTENVNLK